ncbi:MAG: hypothetical protein EXR59_05815 [Dehalococcoidia bacterium]|nr:hypothetical protein [Dehalococcoidia bacterium]
MSKLQEKLEKVNKALSTTTGGFGFLAVHEKAPSSMLLVASLTKTGAKLAGDCNKKGADVLLISLATSADAEGLIKDESIVWGAFIKEAGKDTSEALLKAGVDFTSISSDSPAVVLASEKLGRILDVKPAMTDGDLRTYSALRLEAVVTGIESPVTVSVVASVLRFAMLTGKAVLVSQGKAEISAIELEVLRDAGVKGVVLEVSDKDDLSRLEAMRKLIDGLPVKARKPANRDITSALVPQAAMREESEPRRKADPDEDE